MNTITNSIVASFTNLTNENTYSREFKTMRHVEDYCDYNDNDVALYQLIVNGIFYYSIDAYWYAQAQY